MTQAEIRAAVHQGALAFGVYHANGSDCITGKTQYATKSLAQAAARAANARGWPTNSYRCQWCDCYHIGNRRQDNSKSRKR